MSGMWQDLTVVENNDVLFNLALVLNGAPFNTTGYTLSLVLKANSQATDASGSTFTVGTGLAIVNAALGQITWTLSHSHTATTGQMWWRLDAVDGSNNRTTLMLGHLTVMAA